MNKPQTAQIVTLALVGARLRLADLDAERDTLIATIAALDRLIATPTTTRPTTPTKKRWNQTPAGRRKMSRLMKASHKRRKAELRKTDK